VVCAKSKSVPAAVISEKVIGSIDPVINPPITTCVPSTCFSSTVFGAAIVAPGSPIFIPIGYLNCVGVTFASPKVATLTVPSPINVGSFIDKVKVSPTV
jgi:hypothetical protein